MNLPGSASPVSSHIEQSVDGGAPAQDLAGMPQALSSHHACTTTYAAKDDKIIIEWKATCNFHRKLPKEYKIKLALNGTSHLSVSGHWSDSPQERVLAASSFKDEKSPFVLSLAK